MLYNKNFNYPKHHQISHVTERISNLGALVNQSTRPGEGFIIEVKEQYERTNGRNAAQQARRDLFQHLMFLICLVQMCRRDAYGEAVAAIRTTIQAAETTAAVLSGTIHADESTEQELEVELDAAGHHVQFASPVRRWENLDELSGAAQADGINDLEELVHAWVAQHLPQHSGALDFNVKVRSILAFPQLECSFKLQGPAVQKYEGRILVT